MKLSSEVPGKKQKTKRRIKKKLAWWSFHCLECVFFHKRFFFLLSLPSVPEMRPCLRFSSALRGTGRVSGPLAQPFTSPPCTNSHTSSRSITSSLCLPTTVRGIKGLLQPSGNEIYTHGPFLTSHFHVLSATVSPQHTRTHKCDNHTALYLILNLILFLSNDF